MSKINILGVSDSAYKDVHSIKAMELTKAFGLEYKMFAGDPAIEAFIKGGTIYVNVNNPVETLSEVVLRHEIVHHIKNADEKGYKKLVNLLDKTDDFKTFAQDNDAKYKELYPELNKDKLKDELVSEYIRQNVNRDSFWDYVASKSKDLYAWLKGWLKYFIDMIKDFFKGKEKMLPLKDLRAIEKAILKSQSVIEKKHDLINKLIEKYHIVYHGGHYFLGDFSLDFMSTGEGVQAFGWGLYFTDSYGIAKSYQESLKNKLSDNESVFIEKILNGNISDPIARDIKKAHKKFGQGKKYRHTIDLVNDLRVARKREFLNKHYNTKIWDLNTFSELATYLDEVIAYDPTLFMFQSERVVLCYMQISENTL